MTGINREGVLLQVLAAPLSLQPEMHLICAVLGFCIIEAIFGLIVNWFSLWDIHFGPWNLFQLVLAEFSLWSVVAVHCVCMYQQQFRVRRIRRRERLFLALKGHGTFMYAWNQFTHTCPGNTGKNYFVYCYLLSYKSS